MAKRRFRPGAAWIVGLLSGEPVPLQHTISIASPQISRHTRRVEFDASPQGGGFVLREGEEVVEWGTVIWTSDSAKPLDVAVGQPKWQTFWELATFSPQRFHREGPQNHLSHLALLCHRSASYQVKAIVTI